jgi:hypothetical protein
MRVLIPKYLFGNVGGHCYVDISFIVVPCKRDTTIEITLPIFNNFICFCPKVSKEVLEVFVTNIFDAKVVHCCRPIILRTVQGYCWHAQQRSDAIRVMRPDR